MDSVFINQNIRKLSFVLISMGLYFFLLIGTAKADCTEDFSWIPNSETNIVGYKIYYGLTSGGPYTSVFNVGNLLPEEDNRIHASIPGLTCGIKYYFVCVAVNDAGVESPYSRETVINATVPGSPTNLIIFE